MQVDIEAVQLIYEAKCGKYPTELLDDKLKNILWHEAMREAAYSAVYDGRRAAE